MRQHHVAGERVFVDYAGDSRAQIFVGVLGASTRHLAASRRALVQRRL